MDQKIKRRRNYWINPKLQKAIIMRAIIANLALVGLLYAAEKVFFMKMASMGEQMGFPADHVYYVFLKEQEKVKFWIFIATSGIISALSAWAGVFMSHRIAGPVVRIRNDLHRIANGEKIREIKLRNGDFFQEVADEVNSLTLKLNLRQESAQQGADHQAVNQAVNQADQQTVDKKEDKKIA